MTVGGGFMFLVKSFGGLTKLALGTLQTNSFWAFTTRQRVYVAFMLSVV